MATELQQNALAPGVQVSEVQAEPKIEGVATDVPGIVGIFRRGPTDKAIRSRNFTDLKRIRGGFHEGNIAPIEADLFFQQRKEDTTPNLLVTARVVGAGAAKGIVTLKDANAVSASALDTLKIEAENPGKWSNDVDVSTRKYVLETSATIITGATTVSLNSVQGIEIGDLVRISDGTTTIQLFVRSINLSTKSITFQATTNVATIATLAVVEGLTQHRASSVSNAVLNANDTKVSVNSGRTFRKGHRIVLDDPINDKIVNALITRVNGDDLQFDPIDLTELADILGIPLTSITADKLIDSALSAFVGITNNIIGLTVDITGGTGAPQTTAAVTAFNAAAGQLTFGANLTEDLESDSAYEIPLVEISGLAATSGGSATTLIDSALAAFVDDEFNTGTLEVLTGPATGTYTILDFVSASGTITTTAPMAGTPGIGDTYKVTFTFSEAGAALVDSSTNNTFTAGSLSTANQSGVILDVVGKTLEITAGTGIGQTKTITAFDEVTGTITVGVDWTDIPDGTSVFKVSAVTNVPFSLAVGTLVNSQEFLLLVYELNVLLETHIFLSMESTSEDYVEKRLAGDSNESVLVVLTDQNSAIADPVLAIPAPNSRTPLTGALEGSIPTDLEVIGESGANPTGMFLFNEQDITYFAIPGFYSKVIFDLAAAYAESRGELMYLTGMSASLTSALEALDFRQQTLQNPSNSFVYLHWQQYIVDDPESANPNARITVPSEGLLMGMWSNVSQVRGLAKAPANELLVGVRGLTKIPDDAGDDLGLLNPNGINSTIFERGTGFLPFGARTLDRNTGKRQFTTSRRIINFVRRSIRLGNRPLAFEPNDRDLRDKLVRINTAFLRGLWRQKLLLPLNNQAEAFSVVSDDTNNTDAESAEGITNVDVELNPTIPAERIRFRVSVKEGVGVVGVQEL